MIRTVTHAAVIGALLAACRPEPAMVAPFEVPQGAPPPLPSSDITCVAYDTRFVMETANGPKYRRAAVYTTEGERLRWPDAAPDELGPVWGCIEDAEHDKKLSCECYGYDPGWLAMTNEAGVNPYRQMPVVWGDPRKPSSNE
jgi:hypothetical protein